MTFKHEVTVKPRYLWVALAVIIASVVLLAVMQLYAVGHAERHARATLEANLDLHLMAVVDEARRDMIERASYITHSISHARIRQRDREGLARAYTRAMRRYPEIKNLYAVFLNRGQEHSSWRVLKYEPPDTSTTPTRRFKNVPVGHFTEDERTTEALQAAWFSLPDRSADKTYAVFAPTSSDNGKAEQIFFHSVYEPDHMDRQSELDRVGLIVFTADAVTYPHPSYLADLIARYEAKTSDDALGGLRYCILTDEQHNDASHLATSSSKAASTSRLQMPLSSTLTPLFEPTVVSSPRPLPVSLPLLPPPSPPFMSGLASSTSTASLLPGQADASSAQESRLTTNYMRYRRFEKSDGLYPNMIFMVTPHSLEANQYLRFSANTGLLVSFGAAALALLGVALAWRAMQRELHVAQLKSDFLASVSHELKTPLTAIRAFGDLLHSGRARRPERIAQYGAMITAESDRLTTLINNILELSKLERGIRQYRLTPAHLCETVCQTVGMFRHTASARDFKINVSLSCTPVVARADDGAIRQVIINLLSNAVKYSHRIKRVDVSVEQNATHAIVKVRDYGIGIDPRDQQRIFSAFTRATNTDHDDGAHARPGTGLGLAIVAEIVRAHGGSIEVESQPHHGATFSLCLPLCSDEPVVRAIGNDTV